MFNPNPLTISSHTNYIFVLNFIEKLNIMHCIHKWVIFYTIVCQLVITLCVKGLIFWPWKNLDQLSPLLKMHIELELGCVGTIEASGVASVFIVCRGHTPTTLFLFFLTLIYLRHISFRSSRALLGVFVRKRLQIWEFFPYRKKSWLFYFSFISQPMHWYRGCEKSLKRSKFILEKSLSFLSLCQGIRSFGY